MSARPPVNDWGTDFDHLDPRWVNDPYPIWEELRGKCPVAHTERYMGVYFPTRYDDVRAVAYDTEHFSSRRIVVREQQPPRIPAPPITSDPPGHRADKHLLLPAFTPDQIKLHEPRARKICGKLIDRFAGKDGCDAAVDYAQELPVRMIAHMMGLPEEEGELFRKWIYEILVAGITQPAVMMRAIEESSAYFNAEIEKRKAAPGDDIISYLASARIEGQPIEPERLLGTLRLILVAGIDTTWSAIGSCFWHLARHPEDRRRLVAEPELIPTAVEEFLRAYAPVTMAREVVKEDDDRRLSLQGKADGAAVLPGREPRSRGVPGCRPCGDRPDPESSRRVRPRHPPLHRLESRPHGDHGRAAGMAQAHPRVQSRAGRRGHLVGGHGARPAQAAGQVRLTCRRTRSISGRSPAPWAPRSSASISSTISARRASRRSAKRGSSIA